MNRIKFKGKTTLSLGRNGYLNTTGLAVEQTYPRLDENNKCYDVAAIYSITSRDELGVGHINLPVESIPELIKGLQEIYDNTTRDSTVP